MIPGLKNFMVSIARLNFEKKMARPVTLGSLYLHPLSVKDQEMTATFRNESTVEAIKLTWMLSGNTLL